jgi:hypothetical protein
MSSRNRGANRTPAVGKRVNIFILLFLRSKNIHGSFWSTRVIMLNLRTPTGWLPGRYGSASNPPELWCWSLGLLQAGYLVDMDPLLIHQSYDAEPCDSYRLGPWLIWIRFWSTRVIMLNLGTHTDWAPGKYGSASDPPELWCWTLGLLQAGYLVDMDPLLIHQSYNAESRDSYRLWTW